MAQKEQFILTTNTEAGFNELVKARGLAVVDVHANWCGPCKAIVPAFKRLYFDYGERPIRFLTADADNIPALSQFAKKSQPTFQVYKDGDLVETIHGANAPRLTLVVSQNIPDSDVKDEVVEEQNEQEKKELAEEEALFTQKPAGDQPGEDQNAIPAEKMVVTTSMMPSKNDPHGDPLAQHNAQDGEGAKDEANGQQGEEGQEHEQQAEQGQDKPGSAQGERPTSAAQSAKSPAPAAESAPEQQAPAPTESAPAESTPAESAPAESAPVESAPVESAPVESAPVESAPVESAPVESTPDESAPADA